MNAKLAHLLLASGALALAACAGHTAQTQSDMAAAEAPLPADINSFFEQYNEAQLSLSPETKSFRGIRDGDYRHME